MLRLSQRLHKHFFIFLVILHAIWAAIIFFSRGPILLNDSHQYLTQAQNILEGYFAYCGNLNAPIDEYLFSKRPPLYPIFLFVFGVGKNLLPLILLAQNLLSIFSICILKKIMEERDVFHPLAVSLILLSSFSYFIYVNSIMSEILLIAEVTAMAFLVHRFLKTHKRNLVLWFNIVLVLAIFTKPVFYLFAFVNLLFWLIALKKQLKFALIPLIFVGLFFIRNHYVTQVWHFSSIQNINLLDYNLKYYNMAQHGVDSALSLNAKIHSIADTKTSFKEKTTYINQQAKHNLAGNYFSYAYFHCKGAIRGMFDPGNFDIKALLNKGDEVGFLKKINSGGAINALKAIWTNAPMHFILLSINFANKLALFVGILAFAFLKCKNNLWKLFVLGVFAYIVFLTGPINASRFMLGVFPLQLLATISTVHFLVNKKKKEII